MIETYERPPFGDAVSLTALGILVDAGRVGDASLVLERYGNWAKKLPKADALKLRSIEDRLNLLREIEMTHGDGAAMNLEHPAMIRELSRHARKPFINENHLQNAISYRRLRAAAAGATSVANSSSKS